jgi:hypothetical protein
MARNTVARTLHDVGLAAWFGGSLMGAVGLNAAAGEVSAPAERGRVANAGWDRWTPVNAAAIGAHLLGATVLLGANSKRMAAQEGVSSMAAVKTLLTVAALGVTGYSRVLGRKVSEYGDVPVESGAVPSASTPPEAAKAQKQLRALQWAVPGVTGALLAVSAFAGEQQRPEEFHRGVLSRVNPLSS